MSDFASHLLERFHSRWHAVEKKYRCSRVLISERLPAKRGVVVVAVVVGVVSIDNRSQQRMTEPSQPASSLLVLAIITDWTGNRGNVRSGWTEQSVACARRAPGARASENNALKTAQMSRPRTWGERERERARASVWEWERERKREKSTVVRIPCSRYKRNPIGTGQWEKMDSSGTYHHSIFRINCTIRSWSKDEDQAAPSSSCTAVRPKGLFNRILANDVTQ